MDLVVAVAVVLVALAVAVVIFLSGATGQAAPAVSRWPERARPYEGIIRSAARRYGLDPAVIAAVCEVESNWDPSAVNPGDPSYGIMQVMVTTAQDVRPGTTRADLMDPEICIDVGSAYLAQLRDRYGVPLPDGVDAYNVGPGAYRSGRRNLAYRLRVLEAMPKFGG